MAPRKGHKYPGRTLPAVASRVLGVQDISEADAIAEGAEPILVPPDGGSTPRVEGFRDLWNGINGPGAWDANPFVVAVSFRVLKYNINAIGGGNG